MKASTLRLALLLSVALNLGVIAAVLLDRIQPDTPPASPPLHQLLELRPEQRSRWDAAEGPFLQQFSAAGQQLEQHRSALIDALFADPVDLARVETERAAIADLQQTQQRLMIDQLIAERAILDAAQSAKLHALLRMPSPTHSAVEDLHGK